MRIVRAAAQPVVPWKNGGGTTREVAKSPPAASLDAFAWRVSRAHVASDGPFSRFDGVDRTLLVLEGEGIRLGIEGGEPVTLTRESAPFSFPGDLAVDARLVRDAIDDLNIMTRRGQLEHRVVRRAVTRNETIRASGVTQLVYVERGVVALGDSEDELDAGDAWIGEEREAIFLRPRADALVVIVDLFRRT